MGKPRRRPIQETPTLRGFLRKGFWKRNWPGLLLFFVGGGFQSLIALGYIRPIIWWLALGVCMFGAGWTFWALVGDRVFSSTMARLLGDILVGMLIASISLYGVVKLKFNILGPNIWLQLEDFGVGPDRENRPMVYMVLRVQIRNTPTAIYNWMLVAERDKGELDTAQTVFLDSLTAFGAFGGNLRRMYYGKDWLARKTSPKALDVGDMVVAPIVFEFSNPSRELRVTDITKARLALHYTDSYNNEYTAMLPDSLGVGSVTLRRWPEYQPQIDTVK